MSLEEKKKKVYQQQVFFTLNECVKVKLKTTTKEKCNLI